MPNVQYEVDAIDIEAELMRQGYMVHGQRAFGIQVTVVDPTKKPFKFNGAPHRRILPGVSKEVYRAIRSMSRSAVEAAERVIAISNGQEWNPTDYSQPAPAPALSEATLERIVNNRVDDVVARRAAELDQREQQLVDREAKLEEPVGVKPRKNGGRVSEKMRAHLDKLALQNKARAAAAREQNEPVLTEEQQELAKKAGIPLA